jgi:hypothetical protein
MVDKKKAAGKNEKLGLKKKTVKKISDEDLKKVGGGMKAQGEMCTATCTGHWDSFSPNCGTTCNGSK